MLNNIDSINFTVARLCHEMANSLSVMKFLQENIAPSENNEIQELFKHIDLMTYTMDFFRNIYSSSVNTVRINDVLFSILNLKNISLNGDIDVFSKISIVFSNIICGILYIYIKSCRASDSIILKKDNDKIIISIENRTFPFETIKAFQESSIEENIFNTFILYIKHLAKSHDILIKSNFDSNNTTIVLWNKK